MWAPDTVPGRCALDQGMSREGKILDKAMKLKGPVP